MPWPWSIPAGWNCTNDVRGRGEGNRKTPGDTTPASTFAAFFVGLLSAGWIRSRNPVCIRNDTVALRTGVWRFRQPARSRPLSACNWLRLEDWIWIRRRKLPRGVWNRIAFRRRIRFHAARHFVKFNYPRWRGGYRYDSCHQRFDSPPFQIRFVYPRNVSPRCFFLESCQKSFDFNVFNFIQLDMIAR